jgi:hypothetical protein
VAQKILLPSWGHRQDCQTQTVSLVMQQMTRCVVRPRVWPMAWSEMVETELHAQRIWRGTAGPATAHAPAHGRLTLETAPTAPDPRRSAAIPMKILAENLPRKVNFRPFLLNLQKCHMICYEHHFEQNFHLLLELEVLHHPALEKHD